MGLKDKKLAGPNRGISNIFNRIQRTEQLCRSILEEQPNAAFIKSVGWV